MRIMIQGISVVVCLLVISASRLFCQTDTIGGVINRYTRVVYIECTNNSAIVVQNSYGFKPGDKILIIQMKGAEVNLSTTSSFGGITSYNNAGNYELATIDEVNGNSFVLTHQLSRDYTLSGIVQVVRVPSYSNVLVDDLLQAQPWNGSTGGVLALIASGTVTLNANVYAQGQGFRGAASRWPGLPLTVFSLLDHSSQEEAFIITATCSAGIPVASRGKGYMRSNWIIWHPEASLPTPVAEGIQRIQGAAAAEMHLPAAMEAMMRIMPRTEA